MPGHPDYPAHGTLAFAFDAALKGAPLPAGLTATDPAEVERRFAVYRNNVATSLIEALARRFPVIRRLVGAEFFSAMARIYAEDHRPTSPVLLEWGQGFPGFLAGFAPLKGYPYMADVARIEYARGLAFHAADAPPMDPARLAGTDPLALRLRLAPSVRVLHLGHPAVSIWLQNQPGTAPGTVAPAGAEIALILRDRAFNVPVRPVTGAEARMVEGLGCGETLGVAAEAAVAADPDHDPQPLLLYLIGSGAITDLQETE